MFLRKVFYLAGIFILILGMAQAFAQDVIIDNADAGFSVVGSWSIGSASTDKYGSDYRYAFTTTLLIAVNCTATFQPTLPLTTVYNVYAWYPQGTNRATDTQYIIQYAGGTTTVNVNQQTGGGDWNLLGAYPFTAGSQGKVKVTNYSQTNGKVAMADALLFSPLAVATTDSPQFRAFWIESWNEGMHTPSQVTAMIDTARRYNFNAVVPEVRKIGDAFYKSSYEPWATEIIPAGFDILSCMLQYAHDTSGGKPYIEVHAWMVTYRDWKTGETTTDSTKHIFFTHPEWFTQTYTGVTAESGSMFLDPGIPEVEDYLTNIYLDIVRNYPIDGIHYDYVRYAGTAWGYNSIASTRFHQEYGYAPPTTSSSPNWGTWCQWRRDQVTALVKKVYANAMEINPKVKITGALITWTPFSNNFTTTAPYASVFQDWHGWMNQHILDASIPMAYFRDTVSTQSTAYRGWADFAVDSSYGRHAYIGPAVYLNDSSASAAQIDYALNSASAPGVNLYDYQVTNNGSLSNAAFFSMVSSRFFKNPAPLPEMSWKTNPTTGILKGHILSTATTPLPYFNGSKVYKARVIAKNLSTLSEYTTTSDGTGFYAFMDLPPGNYQVKAYAPVTYTIQASAPSNAISAGSVITVDLTFGSLVPVELVEFKAE
jgi:uncharacterized lipoprotein YddW (UPF0748 family)